MSKAENSLKEHILKIDFFWSRFGNHLKHIKSVKGGREVLLFTQRGLANKG